MCVDCVLASPKIAQVDPDDEPLPEVVLSHSFVAQLVYLSGNVTAGLSLGDEGRRSCFLAR
jgi:hypothetical protein